MHGRRAISIPARWLLLQCLLALASIVTLLPATAHAYRVEIDAPSAIRKILEQFLDISRYKDRKDLNDDQFNFMVDDAEQQVKDLVATEGYFSPRTKVEVDRAGSTPSVRIIVDPGPRTVVAGVRLDVAGAAPPERISEVRRTWSLPVGNPFRQEDWDAAKEDSLRRMRSRDFASAKIQDSRATIDPEARRAELDVQFDSGPGYTLGQLQISGTRRYPATIIRNVNPLREGEPYDAARLLELQRQIQATPYFGNATVDIVRDPEHPLNAPVNVRVSEFPTQLLRGSVGYATDTGARLQGQYSHNNVFSRAWVLDTHASIEQRRQLASVGLSMPPDTRAYVNNVHASYERTTLAGIDLRSSRLGLRRARTTQNYDLAWTLEYYSDELEQLEGAPTPPDIVVQPGTHQALVAGGAWTRRRLDSLQFPRDGHIITFEAGFAVRGLLTEQTFARFLAQGRRYIPVGQRDILLLRAEAGAVITDGGNAEIPASLLFRAGGTNSIRGYTSQSIGTEANGGTYPTRLMTTGSVEYQHWFNQSWGGALFYDVGTATDRWTDRELFHGVGVGARWRSPVGVINADLAYGIQRSEIRPHFSLGIAF